MRFPPSPRAGVYAPAVPLSPSTAEALARALVTVDTSARVEILSTALAHDEELACRARSALGLDQSAVDSLACGLAAQLEELLDGGEEAGQGGSRASQQLQIDANSDSAIARLLPALARRLRRLKLLETRFLDTLEAEKLEAMAEFAAGAGHEINNPLAVISGRAQLFLREETDPQRRRELAVMNSQARRVYDMIADMMLFARPPQPRKDRCDLSALLDRVVADYATKASEQGIAIARSREKGAISIVADPSQLNVAIRAVFDNALAALADGGRVEITASDGDDFVEITIRDDGPGIPPDVRRHLFDPFYSGRASGRGLGLGLSKCWRIVTNHGGTIEVGGTDGRGASFTIRLPKGCLEPLAVDA